MQGWIQPGWAAVKGHSRWTDRLGWATGLVILVHVAGLLGMLFFDRQAFLAMTPVNLLLMQVLSWWTFTGSAKAYARVTIGLWLLGLSVEWLGVHTGLLFGSYAYGEVLGPKLGAVPILIGGNWFLVLSGSLSCAIYVQQRVLDRYARRMSQTTRLLVTRSIPAVGALVATIFDGLLEPAAIKLGFWTWEGGHVPFYNYICWFGVSFLALQFAEGVIHPAASVFSRRLLLVQALFFLLLGFSR